MDRLSSAPTDCRVPDPTDAKADGNFGNHRAGYGDRLDRIIATARKGWTLAAGEGLVLVQEIDRLRKELAQPLTHEAIMKRVADDVGRVVANALDGPRSPFMNREHNPGSLEAVVAGCTCSVMDNHGGQGTLIRYDEAHQPIRAWWIGADCPLHSEPHPTTAQQTGQYD